VPLFFCGEDVCNNHGPMVSPAFLRRRYFPLVKMGVEPLVDAGIRLIHHCDGDVRPRGRGLPGLRLQRVPGIPVRAGDRPVRAEEAPRPARRRAALLRGMSVSRTLPLGTPDDVRDEVDYFLDFTDGGRGMFLFTTNVTGVEVAPDNLRAGYAHVKAWDPAAEKAAHTPPLAVDRVVSAGLCPSGSKEREAR